MEPNSAAITSIIFPLCYRTEYMG